MDEWLAGARAALADVAGMDAAELELTEADEGALLDLARIAARTSGARTNAPLLCYLVGRARTGASLEALAEAVRNASRPAA